MNSIDLNTVTKVFVRREDTVRHKEESSMNQRQKGDGSCHKPRKPQNHLKISLNINSIFFTCTQLGDYRVKTLRERVKTLRGLDWEDLPDTLMLDGWTSELRKSSLFFFLFTKFTLNYLL